MSRPASSFIDGALRLAAGVQEVYGIDGFLPPGSKDQCVKNFEFKFIKSKDMLSLCCKHTIMKSLLGRTKSSTGPHAAAGWNRRTRAC